MLLQNKTYAPPYKTLLAFGKLVGQELKAIRSLLQDAGKILGQDRYFQG